MQGRIRSCPLYPLEYSSVRLNILGCTIHPSLSKLKLPAPWRAFASLSILPERESWGKQSLDHPSSENTNGWAICFSRACLTFNHIHWRYQKDLFKSSELCCSTCCCLLLSALSQWIGLCLGEHMSCSYIERWFLLLFYVFLQVDMGEKEVSYKIGVRSVFNYLSLWKKKKKIQDLLWFINEDFYWLMPPLSLCCNALLFC